ncbi:type II secretion system F family protein [Lentisphaerota bacterium ZTH]|nr:type II secretion system F family protein [Lentisphaerota bacterium]WET05774.1 type II secretion system F family protein [Lentisphaerota bacterium ZTH]
MIYLIYVLVFCSVAAIGYSLFSILFLSHYSSYEERALKAISHRLNDLRLMIDPMKLFHMTLLLAAVLFLIGFAIASENLLVGLFFGTCMGVLGIVVPRLVLTIMYYKRIGKLKQQLPCGLDLLSNSMRAGLTLNQAIYRNVDRVPDILSEELSVIVHECKLGSSLSEALEHWAERVNLLEVKMIVISSELSLARGGNLPETFKTLAEMIRQRLNFEREIKTLTTEGRMQALIMTLLPFILLVVMTLIRSDMMIDFLLSTVGKVMVAIVFIMQTTAYIWIKKLIKIEL